MSNASKTSEAAGEVRLEVRIEAPASGCGRRSPRTSRPGGRRRERTPAECDDKEKGWTFLIDGCLKAYLEGRPLPVWKD